MEDRLCSLNASTASPQGVSAEPRGAGMLVACAANPARGPALLAEEWVLLLVPLVALKKITKSYSASIPRRHLAGL